MTALAVGKLRLEGRYAVGGVDGLHLYIVGGSRAWVLRASVGTLIDASGNRKPRRRDIGLGGFPEVSLAEARDRARALRLKLRDGIDPVEERRQMRAQARLDAARTMTFDACAKAYIEANKDGWKNPKHAQQWTNTLTTYASPILGKLAVADIDTELVQRVLSQPVDAKGERKSFWLVKSETANRVRGRMEIILDWAKTNGYRSGDNPAAWKGHLKHLLPAKSKVQRVQHHEALKYSQIAAFMSALRQRKGISARALEFLILTATRSGETIRARWDEIDLQARIWIIPAERMKAGVEHRVPLSDPAIALLQSLPKVEGCPYVFQAPRGKTLSDMALTMLVRGMWPDKIKVHGFRSTFRDWAGETTSYPREICEQALAHKLAAGVEAAYQRGDFLAKRARLMADWARYCETTQVLAGEVVPIGARSA